MVWTCSEDALVMGGLHVWPHDSRQKCTDVTCGESQTMTPCWDWHGQGKRDIYWGKSFRKQPCFWGGGIGCGISTLSMWDVSKLPSAAWITPCSQSLRPSPSGTSKQPHISTVRKQDCFDLSLKGFHLACSFSSFLIVLSHSDSYYGTVKLCAAESTLYWICYAVQRSKRNSSMTDPRQILKTLHKLLTRSGTIYSQCNTKQDPVCLWHIVKIRSSRFSQLRKALMGSGNCSCNVRQC